MNTGVVPITHSNHVHGEKCTHSGEINTWVNLVSIKQGLLLKERICSPGSKFFHLKVATPTLTRGAVEKTSFIE